MKKIFYNKRRRLPIWSQIYVVWGIIFSLGMLWIWKFEIIKNTESSKSKYDYKKNHETISLQYNSLQKSIAFIKEFNDKEILNIQEQLKPNKWDTEKININVKHAKCEIIKFSPINKKINLAILFDNSKGSSSKVIYTFVMSLIKENLSNVGVVAVNGNPVCNDYVIEKNIFHLEPSGYILVYPSRQKQSGIQTSFLYGHSSIGWNSVIPDSEYRPGIIQQFAHLTLPYFQRTFVKNNKNGFNIIGWHFPEQVYHNELDNTNFILPGILFVVKNFSSVKFYNNYIWMGKDTALSKRGLNIFALCLVLLIWLPIANRLYQKESIRNLFQALFSALFSSFLLFILLGSTRIFSYFIPENTFGPLIVIILGVALFAALHKMHKTTFNVQVNSLTEFLVLVIFSTALGFYNFSIFIFLLPVIFLANKKSELGPGLFKFLFLILISPIFYIAFMLSQKFGFSGSVSLLVLDKVFFTHFYQTIIVILFAGSLISITRDPT